jgi:hypothetical protein
VWHSSLSKLNREKLRFPATDEGGGGGWNDFLLKQHKTNPAIDADVEAFVQELDAVSAVRLNEA